MGYREKEREMLDRCWKWISVQISLLFNMVLVDIVIPRVALPVSHGRDVTHGLPDNAIALET